MVFFTELEKIGMGKKMGKKTPERLKGKRKTKSRKFLWRKNF
ncbi:MAG: hypothetical protein Ct9H300mP18_05290 [Candidatus Neomarinimicrobiota bacterium]|nr:MAG: hypothetical protein Ct9H300mP18_05290 [Candidatus Neomarinimicrobiota bacterium]